MARSAHGCVLDHADAESAPVSESMQYALGFVGHDPLPSPWRPLTVRHLLGRGAERRIGSVR